MVHSEHMNISWRRGPYDRIPSDIPFPPTPPDLERTPEHDEPEWVHIAHKKREREKEKKYQKELKGYEDRMRRI